MKLKKYNQLFEADIKKNKGIPEDYIEGVEQKGRERFGHQGPSHMEMREMMDAMHDIMRIQDGHEEELTEIGKEIILHHYGDILDDVKLDIKIVKPNDEEKSEMVQKMMQKEDEPEIESPEIELPEEDIDQDEVDKRKILNNLMQGEAQNVHSMMHYAKDEIDKIDEDLLHFYTRLLEINRKFDWMDAADLEQMMMQNPEMANAEEVEWEGEEGNETPVIKVRALDLPMLIHETVKGIYELIMANAIPENEYLARRVMKETDTLKDEKQDIKFGPFIAADIRDFITSHLERMHKDALDIPNIKEFIYGSLVELEAKKFIEVIYAILSDDQELADDLIHPIINNTLDSLKEETEEYIEDYDEDDETLVGVEDDETLKPKEKSYADMSKSELDKVLNQALDNEDYETVKKIQEYL
jgi:hypothetical protein